MVVIMMSHDSRSDAIARHSQLLFTETRAVAQPPASSDVRTDVASQPFAGTGTTLIVAGGGP